MAGVHAEPDQWGFCAYILKWNKDSTLKVRCKRTTGVGKVIDLHLIFDPDTKRWCDVERWINDKKQALPPDAARKGKSDSSAARGTQGKKTPDASSNSRADASSPVKKSFWRRLFGR